MIKNINIDGPFWKIGINPIVNLNKRKIMLNENKKEFMTLSLFITLVNLK
jgi:hypothetical protein